MYCRNRWRPVRRTMKKVSIVVRNPWAPPCAAAAIMGENIIGCCDALDFQAEPHLPGSLFQLLHLQLPDRVRET